MDSLEVIQNKGYTSIAEADYNQGASDKAREMAKAMLLDGLPVKQIAAYSGLTEEEIKTL